MDPSQGLLLRQLLGSGEATPRSREFGPAHPLQSQLDANLAPIEDRFLSSLPQAAATAAKLPGEARDLTLDMFGTSTGELADYLPGGREGHIRSPFPNPLRPFEYGKMPISNEGIVDLATDPTTIVPEAKALGTAAKAGAKITGRTMVRGLDALAESDVLGSQLARSAKMPSRAGVVRFGNKPTSSKATKELRTFLNDTTKIKDETGEAATLFHGTPHVFDEFSTDKFGTGAGGDLYGQGVYLTNDPAIASSPGYAKPFIPPRDVQRIDEIRQIYQPGARVGPGYGSPFYSKYDDVISFNESPDGLWSVTVRDSSGRVRTHSSPPTIEGRDGNPNVRIHHAISRQPFDATELGIVPDREAIYILDDPKVREYVSQRPGSWSPDWEPDEMYGNEFWDELVGHAGGSVQAADKIRHAGYDSIKYPGGRAMGGSAHDAYNVFDPRNVIPAFPTDAQAETLLQRLLGK